MKKKYSPPDWEMIVIKIQNDVLLTGSVETGGDVLATDYPEIPDPFENANYYQGEY